MYGGECCRCIDDYLFASSYHSHKREMATRTEHKQPLVCVPNGATNRMVWTDVPSIVVCFGALGQDRMDYIRHSCRPSWPSFTPFCSHFIHSSFLTAVPQLSDQLSSNSKRRGEKKRQPASSVLLSFTNLDRGPLPIAAMLLIHLSCLFCNAIDAINNTF